MTFAISYDGGTNGNSIVLTEVYPSTTTVAANPTTAVYGQPVDLTATVSGPDGDPTPTGTVDFYNGSTLLGTGTLASGIASLPSVTSLPVGDNSITATYLGDSNYAGGTLTVSSGDYQHGFRDRVAECVPGFTDIGLIDHVHGGRRRGQPGSRNALRDVTSTVTARTRWAAEYSRMVSPCSRPRA